MLARAHPVDDAVPASELNLADGEERTAGWPVKALVFAVAAGLLLVPLAATPGLLDVFMIVKESIYRALGLAALLLLTIAIATQGTARLREMVRNRPVMIVVGAIALWTLITTLVSTHRFWSIESSITVTASLLIFLMVWYAAPSVPPAMLDMLVIIAAINTALITLQEYRIWQPFRLEWEGTHLGSTGLIGNPNLVGSYLALAAVIMGAAATAFRGWRRWLHAIGALIAIGGVVISETRTALIAVVGAIVVAAIWRSWKVGIAAVIVIGLGLWAAAEAKVPVMVRLAELPAAARKGQWDELLSERAPAFLTGVEMFQDRPLTGQGPGTYKYHYAGYRLRLPEEYPAAILIGAPMNFGEAHNDHLQLLAETGLPGYILFLAALALLVFPRTGSGDGRAHLVRSIGPPLAAVAIVLALAQFPLQIAVTRHLLVTMAGLLIGWRDR